MLNNVSVSDKPGQHHKFVLLADAGDSKMASGYTSYYLQEVARQGTG
jgi:hypothetical protein